MASYYLIVALSDANRSYFVLPDQMYFVFFTPEI